MTTVEATETEIPREVWRLAWLIACGAFATGLDTSVVHVALRTIQLEYDVTLAAAQWVSTSYLIALAVSLPVCGWLGDRLGTGRLWLGALAAFTVASGLCAAAPSLELLVAARVLQGLAAGLLVPAGQTILGRAVGPGRLGRVMSRLGMAVALAPALGPVLGGLLLDDLGWRWLFLVNLPIGAVVLLAARRLLPTPPGSAGTPLDGVGLAALSIGLPCTVYGLTALGAGGFHPVPILVIGLAALALYVVRSRFRPEPLLDLGLLRIPAFRAAGATMAVAGVLIFGSTLLYPLYFQLARHEDVLTTGLLTFALGLGTALTLPRAGRLVDRYGGGRVALAGGLLDLAVSIELVSVGVDQPILVIQLLLLLQGAGTALLAVPLTVAAYAAVPPHRLADAAVQVNIVNRIGGALGAAIFVVVIDRDLAAGPAVALRHAFAWQLGAAALSVVGALLLTRVQRAGPPRAG
ncbi:DHA2 family efflux MFS transporter permease subunit [Nocardioides nitrophenolicus]|uniref:DHA2 family efflux MFS transporter permease subunit n=1 Tax=Nocardioides nitrophenolicus TaxID=60489 RepID=UPI001960FD85|nr:DHA2 family efflux MFS transporter permease subunit [Nocardioides nitrophenolicus]MBM7520467.1 EmrB/QacA subfamily drug resistance transporter [Nocardioides nitrophenolicus]